MEKESVMDYKELIDALRDEDNCDVLDYIDDAAEAIETLTAENARLLAENERIRSNCYAKDGVQAIIDERDELRAELATSQQETRAAVELVRCKDCRWRDTVLCRASKSIKYDLRREKHTYQTFMEPDGFCSIGERGPQEAGKGETE